MKTLIMCSEGVKTLESYGTILERNFLLFRVLNRPKLGSEGSSRNRVTYWQWQSFGGRGTGGMQVFLMSVHGH